MNEGLIEQVGAGIGSVILAVIFITSTTMTGAVYVTGRARQLGSAGMTGAVYVTGRARQLGSAGMTGLLYMAQSIHNSSTFARTKAKVGGAVAKLKRACPGADLLVRSVRRKVSEGLVQHDDDDDDDDDQDLVDEEDDQDGRPRGDDDDDDDNNNGPGTLVGNPIIIL